MAEVWMDLKGYNGKYQVSNKGRIWSGYRNKILKQKSDKDGYKNLALTTPRGKVKYERVHRLVALMFCHKPEGYNVVHHKNSIKYDNRAENLEWSTVSLNTKHGYHNNPKIKESTTRASLIGADKTRITIDVYKNGEYMGRFEGKEKCALELGLCPKTIYNGLNKKYGSRKGYKFVKVGDADADRT